MAVMFGGVDALKCNAEVLPRITRAYGHRIPPAGITAHVRFRQVNLFYCDMLPKYHFLNFVD